MITEKKYSIIYADPPWQFNNKRTGGSMISGASQKYNTMDNESLCKLPIDKICKDDCVLFMWWVAAMPIEALTVMTEWGFTLKTMNGFNWIKTTAKDNLFFGMGFWTRAGSENCLIATKGKIRPIVKNIRSVIYSPREEHSKKPDIFRDKIVELMGDLPRIELFARQKYEGWDAFGDEINSDIIL